MSRESRPRRVAVAALIIALSLVGTAQAPAAAAVSADPVNGTPNFNGTVLAVVKHRAKVYVGGEFTEVTDGGRTYRRNGAAAFNSKTGRVLPWNPNVSGTVQDLLVRRGAVYIGGTFTRVDGAARSNLAKVKASRDGDVVRFSKPVNGTVYALSGAAKRIYIGGSFSRVGGKSRAKLAAFGQRAPNRLTGWRPKAENGAVRVLKHTRSGMLVGGGFNRMNGHAGYESLAKVTTRTGALLGGFNPPVSVPVLDLDRDRRRVYVAAGGLGGGFVAGYANAGGERRWLRTFDGDVAALALSRKVLYVGGHFDVVCSTNRTAPANGDCLDGGRARGHLAALERGGAVRAWNPGANSTSGVWELTAPARRAWLGVGGAFTRVDGESHGRFALFR